MPKGLALVAVQAVLGVLQVLLAPGILAALGEGCDYTA
jgi:hypothetical protein